MSLLSRMAKQTAKGVVHEWRDIEHATRISVPFGTALRTSIGDVMVIAPGRAVALQSGEVVALDSIWWAADMPR